MQAKVHALLVRDDESPVAELKHMLEKQGVITSQARSRAEAERILTRLERPALIFTDTVLADGTWAEIKALAQSLEPPVPVIVVSRFVDIPLYLDVLEQGAADFLVPPFSEAELAFVVQSALRPPAPSALSLILRRPAGTGVEVSHHAENHAGSRSRAVHA
jgi:DNA-binding NtrC family response regulator